jgi:hypothetical protein
MSSANKIPEHFAEVIENCLSCDTFKLEKYYTEFPGAVSDEDFENCDAQETIGIFNQLEPYYSKLQDTQRNYSVMIRSGQTLKEVNSRKFRFLVRYNPDPFVADPSEIAKGWEFKNVTVNSGILCFRDEDLDTTSVIMTKCLIYDDDGQWTVRNH